MSARRSVRRTGHGFWVRLLLVCGLVLPLSLGLLQPPGAAAASATIATDALRLRTGPGTDYDIITLMYEGQSVTVLDGPQDGWYQVRYGSETGWAFGDYLDLGGGGGDGGASGSATIATDVLRLRDGPGTGYDILDLMYQGEDVSVLDGPTGDGWYQVSYHGEVGWAFGDYLDLGGGGGDDGGGGGGDLPSSATIATDVLNLRSGPGTNHDVVDRMLYGETVKIDDAQGDWYHVEYEGDEGWAFGDYLAFGGDSMSFWVPTRQQEHSLSCEYASLQIATAALGNEIPEDDFIPVVGQADNPHDGFRGNIDADYIYGTDDYGVYPEALANALPEFGFAGEVLYGGRNNLKAHLKRGEPTLVWIDLWWDSSFTMDIDGEPVTMAPGSHVVVAYGYSDEGVLISDPDSSVRKRLIPWDDFMVMWKSMDQMALAVSV
jgi:uncharacterized protein YraI